jgi:hypothetical protein
MLLKTTSFDLERIDLYSLDSLCVGKQFGIRKKADKLKREATTFSPAEMLLIDYTALRIGVENIIL